MKIIDLHGIKHQDVEGIVTQACGGRDIPFVVITGHSRRMKDLVAAAASHFELSVRDTINNPGRVIVDENR